jgi:hypothetical protein
MANQGDQLASATLLVSMVADSRSISTMRPAPSIRTKPHLVGLAWSMQNRSPAPPILVI